MSNTNTLKLEVMMLNVNNVIETMRDLSYLYNAFGKDSIVTVNIDKFNKKFIDWNKGKACLNNDFNVLLWNVLYEMDCMKESSNGNGNGNGNIASISTTIEYSLPVCECINECLEWVRLKEIQGKGGIEKGKGTYEIVRDEFWEYVRELKDLKENGDTDSVENTNNDDKSDKSEKDEKGNN